MPKIRKNNQINLVANVSGEVREETFDGVLYLVAPVVAIREGVLNRIFYSTAEISMSAYEWNGHVIPINHPKRDGEYVSANSREVWATDVVGNFWDVGMSKDKLTGNIWLNLEKAERIGESATNIVARLRAGEPMEVSTGLVADIEDKAGIWNGVKYSGSAHNIRPDHLALLPDEIGACSWDDGCGVPRINQKGSNVPEEIEVSAADVVANEMSLDDRASVVRMAFWDRVQKSQSLYYSDSENFDGDWDVIAVLSDMLVAKNWLTKAHASFPYVLDESSGAVTFQSPTLVQVEYKPVDGGGEVMLLNGGQEAQSKSPSLVARAMRWLRGADELASQEAAAVEVHVDEPSVVEDGVKSVEVVNSHKENESMNRCEKVANLLAHKKNKLAKESLDAASDETLDALAEMFLTNEEAAPAAAVVAVVEPVVAAPAAIPGLAEMQADIAKLTQTVGQLTQAFTANADQEKAQLVASLVANAQCAFDEADLNGMSMAQLNKLASSINPRDYSGAAGAPRVNLDEKETVMAMPKPVWAVAGEGK